LPEEVLVFTSDEARIRNHGIIESQQDIQLNVPVYIGENGIIKTHRKNRIKYSKERTYPVYAIIRIPQADLLSYIKQTLTAGQLGEEAAKYYYQTFQNFSEDNIGSFKTNNSDNGLDIVCYDDPVIVHESKNYCNSLFDLSTSKAGVTQCSKPWLEGHFSGMLLSVNEDKGIIAGAGESEDQDPILHEILEQKIKNVAFFEDIIKTLKIKKKKNGVTFKKTKLVLNGSSIYHVKTPLVGGVTLPFYYCQRNIEAAYKQK